MRLSISHFCLLSSLLLCLAISVNVSAKEMDEDMSLVPVGGEAMVDPFTGSLSTTIPIEVPPGRHGMQPNLALTYWSGGGNSWVGMGWKLEVGAIERQTRFGVNYSGDDYTFRLSGNTGDLVSIGSGEYRVKIEDGFSRIRKLTAADGKPYWEITEKNGTRFLFGQSAASRMADPADANKIFKWCLDWVVDTHGNYMKVVYWGDQGQGYLDRIEYTGYTTNGLESGSTIAPSNAIRFYRETRSDVADMYTTNYRVRTAYRLRTIGLFAGSNLMKAYGLSYNTGQSTLRSRLASVTQFGKDASIDTNGTITGPTALPPIILTTSSTSNTFDWSSWSTDHPIDTSSRMRVGDFSGDGKSDVMFHWSDGNAWVGLSTGSSFTWSSWSTDHPIDTSSRMRVGDFNGDGKSDVMFHWSDGNAWVGLSTGSSFSWSSWSTNHQVDTSDSMRVGDFNGDGKSDVMFHWSDGNAWVGLSTGNSFTWSSWSTKHQVDTSGRIRVGDFNGDGKTDAMFHWSDGNSWVAVSDPASMIPDLLATLENGLTGSSVISYVATTSFTNTLLPFSAPAVGLLSKTDGNGNTTTIAHTYSGGFYHLAERDFRGFNYARVTGPAGPNGEQAITETWFHQGNDTAVDVNTPNVTNGYMKGKPYRVKVTNAAGQVFTETTTTYAADADGAAPFFTPVSQVDTSVCDGTACSKQTRTAYSYDAYGNVTREDQYGDLAVTTDDRTVTRTFAPNTTDWLVGLPATEITYQGIGTTTKRAETVFYYDGVTDCATPASSQTPTKGNITRIVRWLAGGTNPEIRMGYDSYGNQLCLRDANGNGTGMAYDPTHTFRLVTQNALGQQTVTRYYGVDGEPTDKGLYGQVKLVQDPNGAIEYLEYDALGRRTLVQHSVGFWTTFTYNNLGTVGAQHVRTDNSVGLSTWSYFDGFGRTTKIKRTGPDAKVIVTDTQYDVRGEVWKTSLPYFEGIGSPLWRTFAYDPLGRLTKVTQPDSTRVLSCTDDWVTTTVDANNHIKRKTHDAAGRVVTVKEFTGTSTATACPVTEGTLYAATTYEYDVLGNLRFVIDTKGNRTEMQYDTLSRKKAMEDPDMGTWMYQYDAAGNLTRQTDAKGQNLYFQYDALNRRRQKDYGTQKALGSGDVIYTYDGNVANRQGRLASVADSSGTATYFYDAAGRLTRTDKTIGTATFITQTAYDGLGRVTAVAYPDGTAVQYEYNGPMLQRVYEGSLAYVQYGAYDALGQPGTATFGNGVETAYTYSHGGNPTCSQPTFRLCTLLTTRNSATLQNTHYVYDGAGNVTAVNDTINGNQTFAYDELNRQIAATGPYGTLMSSYNEIGNLMFNTQMGMYAYPTASGVRPHAVTSAGSNSYAYDNNGNLTAVTPYNSPTVMTFTTPGVAQWTVPGTGNLDLEITAVGAGAGGGGYSAVSARNGGAGGSGGKALSRRTVAGGSLLTVTVADGGAGGSGQDPATTVTFTSPGTTQWTVPGTGNVELEMTTDGGGGGGGGQMRVRLSSCQLQTLRSGGTGGAGGRAMTRRVVPAGTVLDIQVAQGGAAGLAGANQCEAAPTNGQSGTSSWVKQGGTILAQGEGGTFGSAGTVSSDGVNGSPGSGNGDTVTAGGGSAGGDQNTAGSSGRVTIRYSVSNPGAAGGVTKVEQAGVLLAQGNGGQPGQSGADGGGAGAAGGGNADTVFVGSGAPGGMGGTTDPNQNGSGGGTGWVEIRYSQAGSSPSQMISYDYENRPASITSGSTTTTVVYDGDGGRVNKTIGTTTTIYIGKLFECENGQCIKYVFAGDRRIAMKQVPSEQVSYYHSDHLGSTSVVTNASGTVEQTLAYYPYGGTRTSYSRKLWNGVREVAYLSG